MFSCVEWDSNVLLTLTPFRMGNFGTAHGWEGGAKKSSLPKICHTYPTMIRLGTVLPYLKKIQKSYHNLNFIRIWLEKLLFWGVLLVQVFWGLAPGANLKVYTIVAKRLKLIVRKFWGLIPAFVEVTGEILVGGSFWFPSSLPPHPPQPQ